MRKRMPQKIPTIKSIIMSITISIVAIFTIMLLLVSNLLFTRSIDNAKNEDINNATQISISLKSKLDYMSRLLHFMQQSFADIDFQS